MTYSEAGKLGFTASLESREKLNQDKKDRYQANPKVCKQCGMPLCYEKRMNQFCSSRCAAIMNNKKRNYHRVKKAKTRNKYIQKEINFQTCEVCGKSIPPKRRFCSSKCHKKFNWNEKVRNIEESGCFTGGRGITNQGEASRSFVRKYLTQKYGYKCFICGISEWCGKPITLIVDHIDGNPLNNKIENFRLICPNCDSQLSTYKARNKGHGRQYRRKKINEELKVN